jgi:hypothetical protein
MEQRPQYERAHNVNVITRRQIKLFIGVGLSIFPLVDLIFFCRPEYIDKQAWKYG